MGRSRKHPRSTHGPRRLPVKRFPQCGSVCDTIQCTLDKGFHEEHLAVYGANAHEWKIKRWPAYYQEQTG